MFNKIDNKINIGKIFAKYIEANIRLYYGPDEINREIAGVQLLKSSAKFEEENLYTKYRYPDVIDSMQKYTFLQEMCKKIDSFIKPYLEDGYSLRTEHKVFSKMGMIIPDQILIKKGSPSIIIDQKLNWHKDTKYNKRPNREVKAWLKRYFTVFNNSGVVKDKIFDPCEEIIVHAITIRSHTEPEFKAISYKGEKYGK